MSMEFNGSSQWCIGQSNYPTPPASCSVSLWINADILSGSQRFFGFDNNWELRCSSTTILMELFQGSTVPSFAISTGTWYHVVGTYSGSGTTVSLWVDGVIRSGPSSNSPNGNTARAISIGQRTGASAGESWDGKIDDVRVYNRVLSQEEIETIYATRGGDDIVNGLINWWPISEGAPGVAATGTGTIKDIVGGSDLNPIASPTWEESILNKTRRPG